MSSKSNKKNLLDSIVDYTPEKDTLQSFGNRADHAINSVIHLLESIEDELSRGGSTATATISISTSWSTT